MNELHPAGFNNVGEAGRLAAQERGLGAVDAVGAPLGVAIGGDFFDGEFGGEGQDVGFAVIDGEAGEFGHGTVADGNEAGLGIGGLGVIPEGVVEGLFAVGVAVGEEEGAADTGFGGEAEGRGEGGGGRCRDTRIRYTCGDDTRR